MCRKSRYFVISLMFLSIRSNLMYLKLNFVQNYLLIQKIRSIHLSLMFQN